MQISQTTLPIAHCLRSVGNVFPIRGLDRVFRIVFPPGHQRSFEFTLPFFEQTYYGNAAIYLDWMVLLYGTYEADDVRVIRDILKRIKNPVVLDIGANIGHHTLAMAALSAQIHAFEPFALARKHLQERVGRNQINNVKIYPFGLSDISGDMPFVSPSGANISTGHFDKTGSDLLPLRIGDDVLREQQIERADFIKIDTDGHEPQVLSGLRETIRRCRPVLLVELNMPLAAIAALLPPGYRFISSQRQSRFLNRYKMQPASMQDCQGNVFCLPKNYPTE